MAIRIKVVKKAEGAEDAFSIREEVFMREQGFQNEFDDVDETCYHVIAYEEAAPVACGRFFEKNDDVYTIGRVAVRQAYRGQHLGEALMRFMEEEICRMGGKEIELSAQCRAEGFYQGLGYCAEGDIYQDEFCPHIGMRKKL